MCLIYFVYLVQAIISFDLCTDAKTPQSGKRNNSYAGSVSTVFISLSLCFAGCPVCSCSCQGGSSVRVVAIGDRVSTPYMRTFWLFD